MLDAGAAPFDVELGELALHVGGHAQARLGVLRFALGVGIAEEDEDRVADELVDGAAMGERDVRHLGEVFVE